MGLIRSGGAAGLGIAGVLALALLLAPGAPATVPPKNCGRIDVSGKRYQIKADQIRCATAKTYSRRYLRSHDRPSGYRCSNFGASTKLKFRCSKGIRIFFAIKR
jgi:hypothetical protein